MGAKIRKVTGWIGITLLAVLALGLVVRAVFNFSTGRRLEKVLSQMKSSGTPLTLQEIEPKCPDGDNAAPLWKAAEVLWAVEQKDRIILGDTIQDVFYGRPLDSGRKQRLRSIIESQSRLIGFIIEAAAKSCFKLSDNWASQAPNLDPPDAVKMIQVNRLVGVDAVLMAEEGRAAEAVEQCLAGMRFIKLTLQHPFLINYLVAMADMKQLAVCLQSIVSGRDLPDSLLRRVQDELAVLPWRNGLSRTLQGERILMVETAQNSGLHTVEGGRLYSWVFRPVIKSELIWMLKHYEQYIKAASQSYYENRTKFDELNQQLNKAPAIFRMAGMLFPNLEAAFLKEATLEAVLDSARLGIACKIYRNAHGNYPEKLSDLVPDILKALPLDPFTGKPYVYRMKDSDFIVYSLGSNLRDDEGRGTLNITQLIMEKDDDWFWKEIAR
jgi:hypothetical protein